MSSVCMKRADGYITLSYAGIVRGRASGLASSTKRGKSSFPSVSSHACSRRGRPGTEEMRASEGRPRRASVTARRNTAAHSSSRNSMVKAGERSPHIASPPTVNLTFCQTSQSNVCMWCTFAMANVSRADKNERN